MRCPLTLQVVATALWLAASPVAAQISVTDDTGERVTLVRSANRIVSLAPHATEMLFAIGAGERIVGTISFSDYPEAAKKIPRLGNDKSVDVERVLALSPDLVVAWHSGNAEQQIRKLRELGVPVYVTEPRAILDVATALDKLGALCGTAPQAEAAAGDLRRRLRDVESTYAQRAPVRVFYQVWDRPLMTINGRQVISDALRICGASNVFSALPSLASSVDVEAVLAADPEMIVTSDSSLEEWKTWPHLTAVRRQNLVVLPGDLLNRMGPRIVLGTERLCVAVDAARTKR
jgi:iron complex transport system substrate-binding protein